MRNDVHPPPVRRSRLAVEAPPHASRRLMHHLSDISIYDHPATEHFAPVNLWLSMALLGLAVMAGLMVWIWGS